MKRRIRCLSVKEPHISREERGEKTIELRTQRIAPGPLVLAASAHRDAGGRRRGGELRCLVYVTECRDAVAADRAAACVAPDVADGWHEGLYAICIKVVRPLPRTPVSGKAWIYFVDVDVSDDDLKPRCKCGGIGTDEPHTCPYKSDVNGDDETLCRCCDGCSQECANDI